MGIFYTIGSLVGTLSWGLLGVIGGYLSYRRAETERGFSDYYLWKPFVASLLVMFFAGNLLGRGLGILGVAIAVLIVNVATYLMVWKRTS